MNLLSFYLSFEPTGDKDIDLILSAIANAGKYFHSTERWNDEAPYKSDDDLKGRTPIDWISNAASGAAISIAAKDAELVKLREALKEARGWIVLAEDMGRDTTKALAIVDAALNGGSDA